MVKMVLKSRSAGLSTLIERFANGVPSVEDRSKGRATHHELCMFLQQPTYGTCNCAEAEFYAGSQWTRAELKKLEDSLNAYNGSFTVRPPVEFNRIKPLTPPDGHHKICDWPILSCRCAELRFVDGIDRDIQALHDHWDTEKACARDRKYYEYGPNGVFDFNHGNGPPPPPTTADHLARAFALSAPAESERQEYLAPYRMRG